MEERPKAAVSTWAPLRQSTFRALWVAGLVSNLGAWMHQVGEAWLMTSLTSSPLLVATLESADSLAIFLLATPAGALADVVNRRRMSIWTQAVLLVGALALGVLTLGGGMTPWRLIGLTFFMGIGAAADGPVWQAIVPEVVTREDLPAAVTLGGISVNIARAIGPALGGLVVAAAGSYAVFFLNAVSFAFVIVVLLRWRRTAPASRLPPERLGSAMRSGLRYVRHAPELIATFVRCGLALFGASGLLALLPLYARRELGLGSAGYGTLVGGMGVGAVASAFLLPRLRARLSPDALLATGVLALAAAIATLAIVHNRFVASVVMVAAGMSWISVLATLNVSVQTATPAWVRARVLSVYLLVFQGAIAAGGIAWGAVASRAGIRFGFLAAALCLVAGLAARFWFPLRREEQDLTPTLHWPEPALVCEPLPDDGPVLVTAEYRVPPENVDAFVAAARRLEKQRRRTGAFRWGIYRDQGQADRFVETFLVDSWNEHLRQHERVTGADREVEKAVRALAAEGSQVSVTHFVAVATDRKP